MVLPAFAQFLPVFLGLVGGVSSRVIETRSPPSGRVLILGGGVTGVIAARTLHEQGQL
jgi:NADPH-dependent 2,4-dienoyl-CoA reductase/sulfur reductase-like enzyme